MIRAAAALAAVAALAACGGGGEKVTGAPPGAPATIALTSSAFSSGSEIPAEFTCDGADKAPPLAWDGVPAAARELALVVEDPDAPGGTFVHWTVAGVDPKATTVVGVEGENSFGKRGYGGPCPPEGDKPHRYRFILYALGKRSGVQAGASPSDVRAAIERAQPLARGVLEGRYGR